MKNWYIVQSHSSFENKVAQEIKEEATKANLSDKIEEIIVPTHDITEVKRGKRVQRKKKYFPGYVLIKSEMDNNIYHMIKNLKKVSGFLGSKGTPVPVSDKEVEKYMSKCRAFIYAGIEDFGIAPVEAMASGAPVIAYGKGVILDTVICIKD